jgi:hypothetical protein
MEFDHVTNRYLYIPIDTLKLYPYFLNIHKYNEKSETRSGLLTSNIHKYNEKSQKKNLEKVWKIF